MSRFFLVNQKHSATATRDMIHELFDFYESVLFSKSKTDSVARDI